MSDELHTLLQAVNDYYEHNYALTPTNAKRLANHPTIFHRPPSGMLYRGMDVKKSWLTRVLGYRPKVDSGHARANFTFKPKENSSAWARHLQTAKNYTAAWSNLSYGEDEISVVVVAKTSAGMFYDFGPIAKAIRDAGIGRATNREREVFAVGPVEVSEIHWRCYTQ